VIGWDAAGIVVEAGPQATLFKVGDEVFYAGSIARSGTNAQFHLVDERIVGHKPRTLGFAQAAALPLTAITAWEALFDRIDIRRPVPGAASVVLIIGGAGGRADGNNQYDAFFCDAGTKLRARRTKPRRYNSRGSRRLN
jgi:NADPH2:quinone reductase